MKTQYADLEIGIHRRPAALSVARIENDAAALSGDTNESDDSYPYTVELRYSDPASEVGTDYNPGTALISRIELRALEIDPQVYGERLWQRAFTSSGAEAALDGARAATASATPPVGLRVRLLIGRSAPELHALHWECLRDPRTHALLGTDETLVFSRYLGTQDWRPVPLRPRRTLSALVVIANPRDLEQRGLAKINVASEWQRACKSLQPIPTRCLPTLSSDGQPGGRATLETIATCLRENTPDIVYLVCHGQRSKNGNSRLWLEKDDGTADEVNGGDLAMRIMQLQQRPSLVVLASCASAGSRAELPGLGQLAALGPLLAEAGVPAVLAMQGQVSMATIEQFMPVFFTEMQRDGQLDRALAAARGAVVRDCPDWWMPVLYTRLKRGRIWYDAGFSGNASEFEGWEKLTRRLAVTDSSKKKSTALIGPDLDDVWIGAQADIADSWASEFKYPFAATDTHNLPRIAQFITGQEGRDALQTALFETTGKFLAAHHGAALSEARRESTVWTEEDLITALKAAAMYRWRNAPTAEHLAYRNLARLRLPIYVTLSPSPLLALALEEGGVKPQVRLCPWWTKQTLSEELKEKCLFEDSATPQAPLVYHLFGHLDTPESLVLSEDDYFDFLIGLVRAQENRLVPHILVNALSGSALLFVGFDPAKWSFRVLFRTLMNQPSSERLRAFKHVTAQIEPDEGRNIDIHRARSHLEKAFQEDKIEMYWGSSEQFLSELAHQLDAVAK